MVHDGKQYAKIGDRFYTHHAADRMKPESLGWAAGTERPGVGLAPVFVEDIIRNPVSEMNVMVDGVERTIFKSGEFSIITEQNGKLVITIVRSKQK